MLLMMKIYLVQICLLIMVIEISNAASEGIGLDSLPKTCKPDEVVIVSCNKCRCVKGKFICTMRECASVRDISNVINLLKLSGVDEANLQYLKRAIKNAKSYIQYLPKKLNPIEKELLASSEYNSHEDKDLIIPTIEKQSNCLSTPMNKILIKDLCDTGTLYVKGCNVCHCLNGYNAVCTDRDCDLEANAVSGIENKYVPSQYLGILQKRKCVRGDMYAQGCNICHCLDGFFVACTNKNCPWSAEISVEDAEEETEVPVTIASKPIEVIEDNVDWYNPDGQEDYDVVQGDFSEQGVYITQPGGYKEKKGGCQATEGEHDTEKWEYVTSPGKFIPGKGGCNVEQKAIPKEYFVINSDQDLTLQIKCRHKSNNEVACKICRCNGNHNSVCINYVCSTQELSFFNINEQIEKPKQVSKIINIKCIPKTPFNLFCNVCYCLNGIRAACTKRISSICRKAVVSTENQKRANEISKIFLKTGFANLLPKVDLKRIEQRDTKNDVLKRPKRPKLTELKYQITKYFTQLQKLMENEKIKRKLADRRGDRNKQSTTADYSYEEFNQYLPKIENLHIELQEPKQSKPLIQNSFVSWNKLNPNEIQLPTLKKKFPDILKDIALIKGYNVGDDYDKYSTSQVSGLFPEELKIKPVEAQLFATDSDKITHLRNCVRSKISQVRRWYNFYRRSDMFQNAIAHKLGQTRKWIAQNLQPLDNGNPKTVNGLLPNFFMKSLLECIDELPKANTLNKINNNANYIKSLIRDMIKKKICVNNNLIVESCNVCHCVAGKMAVCTNLPCPKGSVGAANIDKEDTSTKTATTISNTQFKCEVGSIFVRGCDLCHCVDGNSIVCKQKLCNSGLKRSRFTNVQFKFTSQVNFAKDTFGQRNNRKSTNKSKYGGCGHHNYTSIDDGFYDDEDEYFDNSEIEISSQDVVIMGIHWELVTNNNCKINEIIVKDCNICHCLDGINMMCTKRKCPNNKEQILDILIKKDTVKAKCEDNALFVSNGRLCHCTNRNYAVCAVPGFTISTQVLDIKDLNDNSH